MSASVEDTVKIDGVYLPASRDSGNILVQPCNEGYMTWSRFGGYARVRDSKRAVFEDSRAQERRQGSRNLPVGCLVCIRGRVGEVLEGLVGA